MKIDVEYAIKKDIRNNPVVREVDLEHKKELLRTIGLAGLIVLMLLFSAWQHSEIVLNGYAVEQLQRQRETETEKNRQLRLEVETLRAPQAIEEYALRDLHMVVPAASDTITIERAPAATPTKAIVAQVR
jgi:cell division protein FtsL